MEHAHKLCKSNQISTIYIMVDPNARGFYEKMGGCFLREIPSNITNHKIPLYKICIF